MNLYLDLEWIFNRLSHEVSFSQYSALEHPFRQKTIQFLSTHVNTNENVLDLGCKYGEISFLLSKIAKNVIGIDYDKKAIDVAKHNYQNNNLKFFHAEAFEFLSNSNAKYDVLVLSHVLEHLDAPEDFLNRFKTFFKKVYIEVPDYDATYLNQYRMKVGNELLYTDIDHISEFDRDEIERLILSCRLKVIQSERRFGVQRLMCEVL